MAAWFTTKCPGCDRVTSHFKDSRLSRDRVEYDGKRCHRCANPRTLPHHATGALRPHQWSKKGFARLYSKYAGKTGIR
jgi:hypothetical protein